MIDDRTAVDDAAGFDHAVCVDDGVREDDCTGLHLRGGKMCIRDRMIIGLSLRAAKISPG